MTHPHLALFVLLSVGLFACTKESQTGKTGSTNPREFTRPEILGSIEPEDLNESSGVVASRCNDGVLWSHNDSNAKPQVYALNLKGNLLSTVTLNDAENLDWEDIATVSDPDRCRIYIADTGNNYGIREKFTLYEFVEPSIAINQLSTKTALTARRIEFTYELEWGEAIPDVEALMIHPQSRDIFLVQKNKIGPSSVFKLKAAEINSGRGIAIKMGEVAIPSIPPGLITAGDISPDGRHLILTDYLAAYEFKIPEDGLLDRVFKSKPQKIDVGIRSQGESISYSRDGRSIFATSEGRRSSISSVSLRE